MLANQRYVRVTKLADVQASGCLVVPIKGHTLVLFSRGDRLFEES